MIRVIEPSNYGNSTGDLIEMHCLRYRIFKQRLDWDVQVSGGLEIDDFDACHPVYLLQKDACDRLQGCVRLLPTTGATMLRGTFTTLLDGQPAPSSADIWESSRFGVDTLERQASSRGVATPTYELFAGMIEFGLLKHLTRIVTVTDLRMERILWRARWPLERLGAPRAIGKTTAIAGYLEISHERLQAVRIAGHLSGPAIRLPDSLVATGSDRLSTGALPQPI